MPARVLEQVPQQPPQQPRVAADDRGRAIGAVGKSTPFVSGLFERVAGADETIRLLAEEGDGRIPTLGQVSASNSAVWLESLAQRAGGSHGALRSVQEGAEENAKNIATHRFVSKFVNTDRVKTGQLISDVMENHLNNFRDASSALYAPVDEALGTSAVPTDSLKAAAEKLMQSRIGIRGEAAARLLTAIGELPETISFAKASVIRSDLLRINRASDELIKGQAGAIATDLQCCRNQQATRLGRS